MQTSLHLLKERRFLPLFGTQALGAFNDNLFKFSMVILVTYGVYDDPNLDFQFNALASGIFMLPFFLFSALGGQLADNVDKTKITRVVKNLEIILALIGATGLLLGSVPIMLFALFLLGVQSAFFGPIKYAVLPQHLSKEDVLGGTGLIEAGTYVAVLVGTLLGGVIIDRDGNGAEYAAALVVTIAIIGRLFAQYMPPAPPQKSPEPIDYNIIRASWRLVAGTLHIRKLYLAIAAISFFWTIGAVLVIQFPPLVENVLTSTPAVASLFLGVFSIGIAFGSVIINRLLKTQVSARFAPASVLAMGICVILLWVITSGWDTLPNGELYDLRAFVALEQSWIILVVLGAMAVFGGMFVVPLYAFLTTTVDISMTARTVAANNVVNSGFMTLGALSAFLLNIVGVSTVDQLLLVVVMCLLSAWLGLRLHKVCQQEVSGDKAIDSDEKGQKAQ